MKLHAPKAGQIVEVVGRQRFELGANARLSGRLRQSHFELPRRVDGLGDLLQVPQRSRIGPLHGEDLLLEVVYPELLRLERLVEDVLLLEVGPRLGDVTLQLLLQLLNLRLRRLKVVNLSHSSRALSPEYCEKKRAIEALNMIEVGIFKFSKTK